MEIKEDNFSLSNLKEWIKDYSLQDKVRCGIYCSELVTDIYENNYDSKAPRSAIEAAKDWVALPTEDNREAACDAASRANAVLCAARSNSYVVFAASNAAISASAAAEAAASCNDDSVASNYVASESAADAAFFAARAGGDNIKSKIISWIINRATNVEVGMEIKEENVSYLSVKEWIKDYSHQDKVRCAIHSAELVIDIYERNNNSKAPRLAIEAAKEWVASPTEYNRKAACDAASRAFAAVYDARSDLYVVFAAADSAFYAAVSSTRDDDSANSAAAEAVEAAASAGGKNVKAKIISWFSKNTHKC